MNTLARLALLAVLFVGCNPPPVPVGNDAGPAASVQTSPSPAVANDWTESDPRIHSDSKWQPTPNPKWYGQPAYRDPKKLGLGIPLQPPPVYQASWDTPAWFVDPQNASTTASDTNNCTTAVTACLTYAQIAARWGTYSPQLRAPSITITFLSGHTDNTDPVILRPYLTNFTVFTIQGQLPTAAQSGSLVNTISKNRATPQLLQADLGAGGVVGQMIVNTTGGKLSRAFLYKNTAGVTWQFTQPIAPSTVPPVTITPVDTWADGDTFSVFNLPAVNIVDLEPILVDAPAANSNNMLQVYQLTVFDPQGTGRDIITTNGYVTFTECTVNRRNYVKPLLTGGNTNGNGFINVMSRGGIGGGPSLQVLGFGARVLTGGPKVLAGAILFTMQLASARLDNDVIIDVGISVGYGGGNIGAVFIQTGTIFSVFGPTDMRNAVGASPGKFMWGGGVLDVIGSARLVYPSGAGAAQAAWPSAGFTMRMNGGTTAASLAGGAAAVWSTGITVTPLALDTAQDATNFGGLAINPGGSSIANTTM